MSVIEAIRQAAANIVVLGSHPGIIQSILDYDYLCGRETPSILGIVNTGGRKTERYFWGETEIIIPVYAQLDDVPQAVKAHATAVLHVQSARRVLAGMREALEKLPGLKLGVVFAEQTPERHSLELYKLAQAKQVLLLGPASVGLVIPGVIKLGAIGGTQHPQLVSARIFEPGDTAVISTSGGMVNELIHAVTGSGLRISFGVALGGDRYPLTTPAEACLLAEADSSTKRMVYFGELGGHDEYEIAELIKGGHITKPIIAYIAGTVAELFETPPQFGHAKAMAGTQSETASAKKQALREAGATVLDTFADLAPHLNALATVPPEAKSSKTIGERKRYQIISRLSGDAPDGEVQLLGRDLHSVIESNSYASLVLSMLLGKPTINSEKLIGFTDYVLKLLVDHGPYVSGAVNTIVTARAGRDLPSSLAAGLLTVGPRFGGAINGAAETWLTGVKGGLSPKAFVAQHTGIIPGIGHKKYRLDFPDPRVAALSGYAPKDGRYVAFARGVEHETTKKKSNLILNVDGLVAAIMLDLLETELDYTPRQLHELAEIEFFNALFILSRSVGFTAHYLDQRRHDEGLFRMSPDDIRYIGH